MTAEPPPVRPWLRVARRGALLSWALALTLYCVFLGLPLDRGGMLFWVGLGLVAASIGRRRVRTAILDFLPFGVVLVGYDFLRGIASTLGRPTYWYYPIDIDKKMFFGQLPTVWVQEHLRYRPLQWWEMVVGLCYVSYFVVPLVTAGLLWLRNRRDFFRWSYRYVALELVGFTSFALVPTAPPWAAARCTPADVAGHPAHPACIDQMPALAQGGLTGMLSHTHAGVHPYVVRDSVRALNFFHITRADYLLRNGQQISDLVAAVPSLHSGGIMLFSIFMWRRVRWGWRPVLAAYPLLMTFTVVYTGEHYVIDVLTGWLAAVLVTMLAVFVERRLFRQHEPEVDEAAAQPVAVT